MRLFQTVSRYRVFFNNKNSRQYHFASVKLRLVVFASVIFAPVLLWASLPPSDSRSSVWGVGGGERESKVAQCLALMTADEKVPDSKLTRNFACDY